MDSAGFHFNAAIVVCQKTLHSRGATTTIPLAVSTFYEARSTEQGAIIHTPRATRATLEVALLATLFSE